MFLLFSIKLKRFFCNLKHLNVILVMVHGFVVQFRNTLIYILSYFLFYIVLKNLEILDPYQYSCHFQEGLQIVTTLTHLIKMNVQFTSRWFLAIICE